MLGTGEAFSYFLCSGCGCLQIQEIPADLAKHYPEDYYSFSKPRGRKTRLRDRMRKERDRYAYLGRGFLGRLLTAYFPNVPLRHIRDLGLRRQARILDVGSGEGRLLRALAGLGFTDLTGIDPFLAAESSPVPGVRLRKTTIQEVEGPFDLVMLNHSLEHIADQKAVFASIERLLAPGGVAMVRIPTVSSCAWERFGVHWAGLDAPRHLYLHSLESLRFLVSATRLAITSINGDSTALSLWASEQLERGIPFLSGRSFIMHPYRLFLRFRALARTRKLAARLNAAGRGDQICILLARPPSGSGQGN